MEATRNHRNSSRSTAAPANSAAESDKIVSAAEPAAMDEETIALSPLSLLKRLGKSSLELLGKHAIV